MIFVTGALASGKATYARGLGFPDAEVAVDVHEAARDPRRDVDALVRGLCGKGVVTCAEVGSGVVPVDAGARAYRERVGRMAAALARRADAVVRMVCGIPVVIKGAEPFAVELVLLRHAQTPGNAQGRYVGSRHDESITQEGRRQAHTAGAHPDVVHVYVSPMKRARETAEIMFPCAEQAVVEGIREMDFGAFTGRTADEMVDDAEYRAWVNGGCVGRCPGGEGRDDMAERVCTALGRLLREACAAGERRVVVVAHGGTAMAFMDRYVGGERGYWGWNPVNCGGYRVRVRFLEGELEVVSYDSVEPGGLAGKSSP